MTESPSPACPCGSGLAFGDCCGPLLDGRRQATTAEALMRSRYSAYTRLDADYLLRTWHPSTRPDTLQLDREPLHWTGLSVLGSNAGATADEQGSVEFVARFEADGRPGQLHEISRFVREGGRWYYLDGQTRQTPTTKAQKTGRNAPCPCGSGKKYKRCCGRDR